MHVALKKEQTKLYSLTTEKNYFAECALSEERPRTFCYQTKYDVDIIDKRILVQNICINITEVLD